MIFKKTCDRYF